MDRGALQGLCQCLLQPQGIPLPRLFSPFSHLGGVIRRPGLPIGFGHLAIRLSIDPYLKYLQGGRAVRCLS